MCGLWQTAALPWCALVSLLAWRVPGVYLWLCIPRLCIDRCWGAAAACACTALAVSVHRVVLYNRNECCHHRLNEPDSGGSGGGYTIYVGSDSVNPTANTVCFSHAKSDNFGLPNILYHSCTQPVTGQYVFLYLPGTKRVLHLNQMRVFAGGVCMA